MHEVRALAEERVSELRGMRERDALDCALSATTERLAETRKALEVAVERAEKAETNQRLLQEEFTARVEEQLVQLRQDHKESLASIETLGRQLREAQDRYHAEIGKPLKERLDAELRPIAEMQRAQYAREAELKGELAKAQAEISRLVHADLSGVRKACAWCGAKPEHQEKTDQ